MSRLYEDLLTDIGNQIDIPGLKPDSNNSCIVKLKTGVKVQLEMDQTEKYFVVGSDLGEVPLGRYRENLFRAALIANGILPPRYGIIAFSKKANKLIIFERFLANSVNANQVLEFLEPFSQKAETWRDAIGRGDIPQSEVARRPTGLKGGIFGIR